MGRKTPFPGPLVFPPGVVDHRGGGDPGCAREPGCLAPDELVVLSSGLRRADGYVDGLSTFGVELRVRVEPMDYPVGCSSDGLLHADRAAEPEAAVMDFLDPGLAFWVLLQVKAAFVCLELATRLVGRSLAWQPPA